jgi:pyrrolysine biosynthesis protein PylD
MTRLNVDNMQSIREHHKSNERFLLQNINCSFLDIGAHAMNIDIRKAELETLKAACVPITTGLGEITGFSKNVSSILTDCCGVKSFVTNNKDIAGFQEAYERGADILFAADDYTFSAFNLKDHLYADNSKATGRGFAVALELAAGSMEGMEVLVLGAGPVGQAGADYLTERKAIVKVFDKSIGKAKDLETKNKKVEVLSNLGNTSWKYILEATNSTDTISEDNITNDTICSAPGVPLGLEESAINKSKLVIHNLLELGVVTMLCGVLKV